MGALSFAWLKGHGTENDFVLLPDHDGDIHGDLDQTFAAALCHRRRGLGADGVIRVVRSSALDVDPTLAGDSEWFMDYRNADGSFSEMCGNGIRVLALHLAQEGLVPCAEPVAIGTHDGVKTVTVSDQDTIAVDMGVAETRGETKVSVGESTWSAQHVDVGNPHAVAFVDDLADAGDLRTEPSYDRGVYPAGVNVEFVTRRGAHHLAMRVHERGSGETRSCGTGACAVAVASAMADRIERGGPRADGATGTSTDGDAAAYRVDLPGGTLRIEWRPDGRVLMTGPARIVAGGILDWYGEGPAR